MKPDLFFTSIVEPNLQRLFALHDVALPVTDEARVMVMAIAGQESAWSQRRQIGIGQYFPQKVGARGYWQFESTWSGPVAIDDVLQKARRQIEAVCASLEIPCDRLTLYEACAWNDTLAVALARLLLWIDPAPLPEIGDVDAAWNYYRRNWKPGMPHPKAWLGNYEQALKHCAGYVPGQGKLAL